MYKLSSKKSVILLLIAIILGAILCPGILFSKDMSASAVSWNNYIFEDYHVKVEVTDKNKYIVEENFTVLYGDPQGGGLHKGIVREIPLITRIDKEVDGEKFSRDYYLKYSGVSANELYDYYVSDDWLCIELGGDDYINYNGSVSKNYTVKYTLNMGDDYNSDYDFFFFNIIGDDYPVPINAVEFEIILPYDFDQQPVYYVGKHGSTIPTKLGEKTLLEDGRVRLTGEYGQLLSKTALSIDLTFEEGYYKGLEGVVKTRKALDLTVVILSLVIAVGVVIGVVVFYNKKKKPVETVEFYPPLDTTPVDAAYLLNGAVTPQDMMSLIVYWASKGLVKIELNEYKEPVKVKKLQNITEQAPDYEKIIFNTMFEYLDTFSLKARNSDVAKKIVDAQASVKVHNGELESGRCKKVKKTFGFIAFLPIILSLIVEATRVNNIASFIIPSIFIVVFVGVGFYLLNEIISNKESGWTHIFPLLILSVVLSGFVWAGLIGMYTSIWVSILRFLPFLVFVLTKKALHEYDSKVIDKVGLLSGFKKNLRLVEEKKLKELVDEDPEYFYHILPYAYTMGIAKNFIEKFENIAVYENENFGGPVTYVYISHIRHVSHSIAPRSSSGGGFGGGGGGAGGGAGGGGSSGR